MQPILDYLRKNERKDRSARIHNGLMAPGALRMKALDKCRQ
jgi:hypothetical protein